VLVFIALASFLIVPQGSSVKSCEQILLQNGRYDCLTALALSSLNASVCGYVQGPYADNCYALVAEKSDNVTTCGSISDNASQGACVSLIAVPQQNYTACAQAPEPYASKCIERIALQTNNQSICSYASDNDTQTECSSILAIRNATGSGNATYCEEVTDTSNRTINDQIIANFSSATNSSAYANNQSGYFLSSLAMLPNVTYTAMDYCYTTLAVQTSNPGLCDNVSSGEVQSICQTAAGAQSASNTTANYTQELAACAQTGSYMQECDESVTLAQAVLTENATMCATLPSALGTQCYTLLASTYNDTSYCGYIYNATAHDSCVSGS
jgi:hypothetical protein